MADRARTPSQHDLAFLAAIRALEANFDRTWWDDLAEPGFEVGEAEISLLTSTDDVVEVRVTDEGRRVRIGRFTDAVSSRVPARSADIARTLGMNTEDSRVLLERVEHALRAGIAAYTATAPADELMQARLVRNMRTLAEGLDRIQRVYGDHVNLSHEDPDTFGAGHFVFYPLGPTRSCFAIEEQFAPDTDGDDIDRTPTSWRWRAERVVRDTDGSQRWRTLAAGEVASDAVADLLRHAERWARRTHLAGERAEATRRSIPFSASRPDVPQI